MLFGHLEPTSTHKRARLRETQTALCAHVYTQIERLAANPETQYRALCELSSTLSTTARKRASSRSSKPVAALEER